MKLVRRLCILVIGIQKQNILSLESMGIVIFFLFDLPLFSYLQVDVIRSCMV